MPRGVDTTAAAAPEVADKPAATRGAGAGGLARDTTPAFADTPGAANGRPGMQKVDHTATLAGAADHSNATTGTTGDGRNGEYLGPRNVPGQGTVLGRHQSGEGRAMDPMVGPGDRGRETGTNGNDGRPAARDTAPDFGPPGADRSVSGARPDAAHEPADQRAEVAGPPPAGVDGRTYAGAVDAADTSGDPVVVEMPADQAGGNTGRDGGTGRDGSGTVLAEVSVDERGQGGAEGADGMLSAAFGAGPEVAPQRDAHVDIIDDGSGSARDDGSARDAGSGSGSTADGIDADGVARSGSGQEPVNLDTGSVADADGVLRSSAGFEGFGDDASADRPGGAEAGTGDGARGPGSDDPSRAWAQEPGGDWLDGTGGMPEFSQRLGDGPADVSGDGHGGDAADSRVDISRLLNDPALDARVRSDLADGRIEIGEDGRVFFDVSDDPTTKGAIDTYLGEQANADRAWGELAEGMERVGIDMPNNTRDRLDDDRALFPKALAEAHAKAVREGRPVTDVDQVADAGREYFLAQDRADETGMEARGAIENYLNARYGDTGSEAGDVPPGTDRPGDRPGEVVSGEVLSRTDGPGSGDTPFTGDGTRVGRDGININVDNVVNVGDRGGDGNEGRGGGGLRDAIMVGTGAVRLVQEVGGIAGDGATERPEGADGGTKPHMLKRIGQMALTAGKLLALAIPKAVSFLVTEGAKLGIRAKRVIGDEIGDRRSLTTLDMVRSQRTGRTGFVVDNVSVPDRFVDSDRDSGGDG